MARDWEAEGIPPPPPRLEQHANRGNGRFMPVRNQPDRCAWAAARWTIEGWTMQEIADALELNSKSSAHAYVQRGLRATREANAVVVEQARAAHRTRLEYALEVAIDILETEHVQVSHGRIVKDDTGTPILDDGPRLAAIDRLRSLSESLRKLDSIDQPAKIEKTVTEVTQQDAELAELVNEYKAKNASIEQEIRARRANRG